MTDAPLLLATTGNFLLKYAATEEERAAIKAGIADHSQQLADVFSKLSADQLDKLCRISLDVLQDAGPLSMKVVDDAEAMFEEAPRQQVDLSNWFLGAALAASAFATVILAARVAVVKFGKNGFEARFHEGLPPELPQTVKEVGAAIAAIHPVTERLADPSQPAIET
jgi:hypothetical protein